MNYLFTECDGGGLHESTFDAMLDEIDSSIESLVPDNSEMDSLATEIVKEFDEIVSSGTIPLSDFSSITNTVAQDGSNRRALLEQRGIIVFDSNIFIGKTNTSKDYEGKDDVELIRRLYFSGMSLDSISSLFNNITDFSVAYSKRVTTASKITRGYSYQTTEYNDSVISTTHAFLGLNLPNPPANAYTTIVSYTPTYTYATYGFNLNAEDRGKFIRVNVDGEVTDVELWGEGSEVKYTLKYQLPNMNISYAYGELIFSCSSKFKFEPIENDCYDAMGIHYLDSWIEATSLDYTKLNNLGVSEEKVQDSIYGREYNTPNLDADELYSYLYASYTIEDKTYFDRLRKALTEEEMIELLERRQNVKYIDLNLGASDLSSQISDRTSSSSTSVSADRDRILKAQEFMELQVYRVINLMYLMNSNIVSNLYEGALNIVVSNSTTIKQITGIEEPVTSLDEYPDILSYEWNDWGFVTDDIDAFMRFYRKSAPHWLRKFFGDLSDFGKSLYNNTIGLLFRLIERANKLIRRIELAIDKLIRQARPWMDKINTMLNMTTGFAFGRSYQLSWIRCSLGSVGALSARPLIQGLIDKVVKYSDKLLKAISGVNKAMSFVSDSLFCSLAKYMEALFPNPTALKYLPCTVTFSLDFGMEALGLSSGIGANIQGLRRMIDAFKKKGSLMYLGVSNLAGSLSIELGANAYCVE